MTLCSILTFVLSMYIYRYIRGFDTRSTTKGDEEKLLRFERRIPKRIYGLIIRNLDSGGCERRKTLEIVRSIQ